MSRQPRIEYAGALYHVMSRGDRQEAIYRDDTDRKLFVDTLEQACGRTGWRVHCYVLLGNHYHILLETPEANLVVGMQWLQSTYTKRFNRKHRECGHVFQGRYKSLLIDPDSEEYFEVVSTYIHLNPARARLFDLVNGKLQDFCWSSYPYYIGGVKRPSWLSVGRVLQCHGLADNRKGRLAYQRYLQSRVTEIAKSRRPSDVDPDWSKIRRGWFLGSKDFQATLFKKLDALRTLTKPSSLSGQEIQEHNEHQARRLKARLLKALGLTEKSLASLPKGAAEKQVLAWYIRSRTTVSNAWLSEHLKCGHPANIPGYIKTVREHRSKDMKRLIRDVLKSED